MLESGLDVSIVALNDGDSEVVHPSVATLLEQSRVVYVHSYSRTRVLRDFFAIFLKAPLRTVSALITALRSADRWRYFQALPIARLVIERRIQYLHAHFADQNLKFASAVATWTALPYGFTVHGYDIRDTPIERYELQALAERATTIVTVSEDFKRRITRQFHLPQEKVFVSYNGTRVDKFKPSANVGQHDPFRLIAVGRLVPIKGHDVLIRALGVVRDRGYAFTCNLVGSGESQSSLESLSRQLFLDEYITFKGYQSQRSIIALLEASDLLVMPSRDESFGVACIEGMAVGLPAVASRVGGLPEVVTEGENGLLVDSENPTELAEAIIYLMERPSECASMGKKAREVVVAKFSSGAVVEKLLLHLNERLASSLPETSRT